VFFRSKTLLHMLRTGIGTDRRSGLPRQRGPVLEENRTRQRGTWEVAATAGSAESARGISPRAAHRTVRKPLDLYGSCHRAKAAAFR